MQITPSAGLLEALSSVTQSAKARPALQPAKTPVAEPKAADGARPGPPQPHLGRNLDILV
jgi:hypothetical protein